jgi:hypothetical protein
VGAGGYANPYSPVTPGYGVGNPYSPVDPYLGNPYSPYNPYTPYSPYNNLYSAGSYLMGSADVMRAYGTVITSQEQARILREQALQAKLDTRKKAFELEMYIKANTPTYTQEKEKEMRSTLRRIQTNSLPGEVSNGKSLNFLLDDLRKFPKRTSALEPLALSDGILAHINVTKNTFGLSVLRDDGRVVWPGAISEKMTVNQRRELDTQIQALVKDAYKGKQVDPIALKDLRNEIDRIREDLVKRVNEVPFHQYTDAKRFLQDFHEATIALERGEGTHQAKFQREVEGGKSVQEVVEYMIREGLRFAPAGARDEAAYRAFHSVLANLNIAMNVQFGSEPKDQ